MSAMCRYMEEMAAEQEFEALEKEQAARRSAPHAQAETGGAPDPMQQLEAAVAVA